MIGNKLTLFVVRLKYYDLRPVVVNLLFGFEKCLLTKQNLLTTCPTLLLLLLICFGIFCVTVGVSQRTMDRSLYTWVDGMTSCPYLTQVTNYSYRRGGTLEDCY